MTVLNDEGVKLFKNIKTSRITDSRYLYKKLKYENDYADYKYKFNMFATNLQIVLMLLTIPLVFLMIYVNINLRIPILFFIFSLWFIHLFLKWIK